MKSQQQLPNSPGGSGCTCCSTNTRQSDWSKRFFAWVLKQGNDDYERAMSDRKRTLFANLEGTVLELGPGAGVNLPYYPKSVRWIGVEPNPYIHPYLQQQAEQAKLQAELITGTSEALPLPDHSVDAVVSTLVLCSVADLATTFREIQRVLKPGGRYLFIEHVAAPQGTGLRRLQWSLRPIFRYLADGCNPDRETWVALEQAGFTHLQYDRFNAPMPVVAPHIAGVATA